MSVGTELRTSFALMVFLQSAVPALPCTLCGGNIYSRPTLRQEGERSRIVLAGKLGEAREDVNLPGGGTTVFHIDHIVKGADLLAQQSKVVLPRFLPSDDKGRNTTWLLFGEIRNGRFDYQSARPISDKTTIDYLRSTLATSQKPRSEFLQSLPKYLENPVPEIAADAFQELTAATDAEIGRLSRETSPSLLRRLLSSNKTPVERIGLIAFLLAGCGEAKDAETLRELLERDWERVRESYSGLLAGYIVLQPVSGWKRAEEVVRSKKHPFLQRYAVLGTVRFLHEAQQQIDRKNFLIVFDASLDDDDIADMVIEDLRRWQWWDLERRIIAKMPQKDSDGPMLRRAIVRFALSCPNKDSQRFIAQQRRTDPEFVSQMEASLRDEGK